MAKCSLYYTQVTKKKIHFEEDISCISLVNRLIKQGMDATQLALTWVGWPNGEKLASTCVHDPDQTSASRLKSMQVHARSGKTGSKVTQVFNLKIKR